MRFFTSDIHFCDYSTLLQERRPFKNTKKYDNFIIKKFNKTAKKGDTIYVVGDLVDCDGKDCQTWKKAFCLVKKIKADIILILGNNEKRIIKYFFDNKFSKFKEYCLKNGIKDVKKHEIVFFAGKEFYLTHEPKDHKKEYINLFGHHHRALGVWKTFGLNVGVDLNQFNLYSEADILFELEQKEKYWKIDASLNLV